jgi:hypothetical protein
MKIKTLAAACLAMASFGASAEWVEIGTSEKHTLYANLQSLRKSDGTAKMWHVMNFSSVQTLQNEHFLSMRQRNEYDCKGELYRILNISFHSENMALGKTVLANNDISKWTPIPPETLIQDAFKSACGES